MTNQSCSPPYFAPGSLCQLRWGVRTTTFSWSEPLTHENFIYTHKYVDLPKGVLVMVQGDVIIGDLYKHQYTVVLWDHQLYLVNEESLKLFTA